MVALSFSGVVVVLYGGVENTIFCITLMIFLKVLPWDSFDELEYITTGMN